jgi:cysteine-rich repeat protein
VFNASCDDGNLVNGDGCSNQCQVEGNYQCFNGTSTTASNCLYTSPLSLTITNILKTLDSNQMEVDLTVNNGLAPLDKTAIASFVIITIGGNLMTNLSVTFDSKTAKLTILVPYLSNIEGQPVVINFGYDPSKFKLAADVLSFDAKGMNMALVYESSPAGQDQIVQSIGYAVACLSVVVLLASTPFHRIIGLETFQVTQIVFFTRYMIADGNSGTFQALNSLKYINFYNFFSDYPNVHKLLGPLIRLGISKSFLFNVLIQVFLLVVVWIFFAFFNNKYSKVKQMNLTESGNAINLLKKYKTLSYIFGNYVFTLTASTFFLLAFSYLSSTQSSSEAETSLPPEIMIVNIALFAYACLLICKELYFNFRDARKYNEEEGSYFRYLTIFLLYS